jgi:hypothetical protein
LYPFNYKTWCWSDDIVIDLTTEEQEANERFLASLVTPVPVLLPVFPVTYSVNGSANNGRVVKNEVGSILTSESETSITKRAPGTYDQASLSNELYENNFDVTVDDFSLLNTPKLKKRNMSKILVDLVNDDDATAVNYEASTCRQIIQTGGETLSSSSSTTCYEKLYDTEDEKQDNGGKDIGGGKKKLGGKQAKT